MGVCMKKRFINALKTRAFGCEKIFMEEWELFLDGFKTWVPGCGKNPFMWVVVIFHLAILAFVCSVSLLLKIGKLLIS